MIGRPRVHHRLTDSTNARARELAAGGAPHGTLVTAEEQTAGRGRQGRSWVAAPGAALLMSLVVRDSELALLPLAVPVAVCDAVGPRARIKWPNDVWLTDDGRKLAGILVEGRPQEGWAVVGIGINAGEPPAEVRDIAASLGAAPEEVLAELLPALDARLGEGAPEILAAWRERDALLGTEIIWAEGSGTAAGIADTGGLLVDTASGRVELDAGEVHLSPG